MVSPFYCWNDQVGCDPDLALPAENVEQNALAILGAHAGVQSRHPAKRPARDPHSCADRNLASNWRGWSFGQLNESVSVDHGFETVDFVVGAVSRAIADSDQAQDAKRAVDRSPAIDDAAEQITPEQRRGGALRLDQGQEHLEAAVHAKPLGGENFALRKAADDAPKSWHGRGNCRNASFGQDRNGDIVASNPLPNGDARMPLSPEAQNILRALSEPIDQQRRWDFLD
jgi:hypothetical protein